MPINFSKLEELRDVEYKLPCNLLADFVQFRQFFIFGVETDNAMIDNKHNFCQSLRIFVNLLILHPIVVDPVVLVLLEVLLRLVGVSIGIHPAAMKVGEAS